jgi:hypothetical protein
MPDNRYNGQFRPEFSRLYKDKDLWWVVPFRVRYIVGLAGYRWTGKSTVIAYLVEKQGFEVYTLSMTLRRIADEKGVSASSRPALQDLGDELRRQHGLDYLARRTLRYIRSDHLAHRGSPARAARLIVAGFKRPEEVNVFQDIHGFELLALTTATDEARYERAQISGIARSELKLDPSAGHPDMNLIYEHLDHRDRFGDETDPYGQAVEKVIKLVDTQCQLPNDGGDIGALLSEVDKRIRAFDLRYRLPRGG